VAQHGGDVRSDVCKLAASYHSTRLVVAITRCAQSLLARRDTLTVCCSSPIDWEEDWQQFGLRYYSYCWWTRHFRGVSSKQERAVSG
jgi:hypothetical protein